MQSRIIRVIVVPVVMALVAACRDKAELAPRTCSVSVQPASLVLTVGQVSALGATVLCDRGPTPGVRWTTTTPGVVSVDSLTGLVVGVAPGAALVTAIVAGAPDAHADVAVGVSPTQCTSLLSVQITPGSAVLTVGDTVQVTAVARLGCDSTSAVTWVVADTTIATVDASGHLVGRRAGTTQATAIVQANPQLRATIPVTVGPRLTVSPTSLALAALDTARLRWTIELPADAPAAQRRVTFLSLDPCAVTVDSTGLVTAIQWGASTGVIVAAAAFPTVAKRVDVQVPVTNFPPGQSFSVQSITAGSPPTDADLRAVRGTITVRATVRRQLVPNGGGHAELWLAGVLDTTVTFPPFTPGERNAALLFTVDTDRRDAAGTRVFPNGDQSLEIRFFTDAVPLVPGCPAPLGGPLGKVQQALTLANP